MTGDALCRPRLVQEARLRQLDDLLAREPKAIEAEVERAALLNALVAPSMRGKLILRSSNERQRILVR